MDQKSSKIKENLQKILKFHVDKKKIFSKKITNNFDIARAGIKFLN